MSVLKATTLLMEFVSNVMMEKFSMKKNNLVKIVPTIVNIVSLTLPIQIKFVTYAKIVST